MEWLQRLLDGESGMAVQLVLITLGLVILLILLFWIFRKITGAAAPKSARNRVPRLSVTDSARVDENRYLVLVRRDNVEHLVMIGGPADLVVETNIVRIASDAQTKTTRVMATAVSDGRDNSSIAAEKNLEPTRSVATVAAAAPPTAVFADPPTPSIDQPNSNNKQSSGSPQTATTQHSARPIEPNPASVETVEKALEIKEPENAIVKAKIGESEPKDIPSATAAGQALNRPIAENASEEIDAPLAVTPAPVVEPALAPDIDLEMEFEAQMEEEISAIAEIEGARAKAKSGANPNTPDDTISVPTATQSSPEPSSEIEVDLADSDLESAISKQLGDMLGDGKASKPHSELQTEMPAEPQTIEQVEPVVEGPASPVEQTNGSIAAETAESEDKKPPKKEKDDIQRLLDELAGVKESAE